MLFFIICRKFRIRQSGARADRSAKEPAFGMATARAVSVSYTPNFVNGLFSGTIGLDVLYRESHSLYVRVF